MKRIAWIILGCMSLVTTAHAASFDCKKAQTDIEKLICKTRELSNLDWELGKVYQTQLDKADVEKKNFIISEQKEWLKNVRDVCKDKVCLITAYASRLIKVVQHEDVEVMPITEAGAKLSVINEFDSKLRRLGIPKGSIISCDYVIELIQQVSTGRDTSYGAVCTLKGGAQGAGYTLNICDDVMIGKLTLGNGDMSYYGFAKFTLFNCPAGG